MRSGFRPQVFIILIPLVFALIITPFILADDDSPANCPSGQGYWKAATTWPVNEMTLGGQTYSAEELRALLDTSAEGDASLILAHQLIAAKLNQAAGQDTTVIAGIIAQADTTLSAFAGRLPYNIAPSSSDGQAAASLGGVLDIYNNGGLTLNCTITPSPSASVTATPTPDGSATLTLTPAGTLTPTPQVTPTPISGGDDIIIIIEGPVQAININIITIYNINIIISPDDPMLTVIKIGDVLRIEGILQGGFGGDDDDDDDDGGSTNITIIIIAITIIFIDVDVVIIDTGQVWRDDGGCGNPPPDWAPAIGWRRRCQGGGGGGMGMGRSDDDDDDDD